MASFPDNLPPAGVELIYKLLIYFGILYILTTAITTWLVTRRRSFPKAVEVPAEPVERSAPSTPSTPTTAQPLVGISQALSFDDTQDKLSSMKIEVQGAEAALVKLKELQKKDQLSPEAYMKLSSRYNDLVSKIKAEMSLMLQSDIESNSGEIDSGISEDDIEAIEADLEQQLMDLDNDDSFLKTRPKRNMNEIFDEEAKEETPAATPAAQAATPPAEKKRVPMPPPPKKNVSSPPPPASSGATPPAPSGEKSAMMPPPPKKAQAPPPPSSASSGATPPKATPPAAPTSSQPLSAAQPMKVESEDDDGMFAKSTSIAALRMDMLRELARLKKLIPEDQEKDQ